MPSPVVLPKLSSLTSQDKMPSIWVQITMGLIGTFAFSQVYSIQAILPVLMQDFSASEAQIGLAVGATVMALAIMSPFMGIISDAIGRKNIMVMSILFLALPTFMLSFSQSITSMIVWRFLQGLSVPGIGVVVIAYVGEEYQGKAVAKLMSYYVLGTVLGGFLGRFALGHLHEIIGWRKAFWCLSGFTFLGGIIAWVSLPASRHFTPNRNMTTALMTLRQHFHNRYVISACLLGFCVLFSMVGCFTYVNLHLTAAPYFLTSADLANIFAIYLIGIVVTPVAGRLIAKYRAARMLMVAIPLSMLGVGMTLLSPLWLVILGLAIMASGVFVTQSATITYIAVNVTQGRSLASGLYYMSYYAGGFVGAWLCGIAYSHSAWLGTVVLLIAVQVVAFLLAKFGFVRRMNQ